MLKLVLSLIITSIASAEATSQPSLQTGSFEITFTQRSPQSAYDKLIDRIGDKDIGSDYNLSEQPFAVYVPADFSKENPLGIVVYMNKAGAMETPATLQPVLDKRHLIFIMAKNPDLSLGNETGLSIDAVFNLKARYPIDDHRVFLMGTDWIEWAGICTSDVFAGDVWIWNTGYWKSFSINRTQTYQGLGHPPSDRMLAIARHRPHVFGFETDNHNDGIRSLIPGQMTRDGFEHMFKAVITPDDIAYPNLRPQWFESMLNMLESVSIPETRPTSRPDSDTEAASLLKMGQAYVMAGKTDLARQKLETLIQKYPTDPAAAKAKRLLNLMK